MADLDRTSATSGLTEAEAKEFHSFFMLGFIVFTVIAIVAHFLVWQWRPWIPGPEGYTAIDKVNSAISSIAPFVA